MIRVHDVPLLARRWYLLLGSGAVLIASCDKLAEVELAGACNINSDCTAPLVCAFQVCHQQCATSRDCPVPGICVKGGGQSGLDGQAVADDVCEQVACTSNSQCPNGQTCAVDGQCRDSCTSARDCITGQECIGGVCADSTSLTDAGTLEGTSDGGSLGVSCTLSSDCGDAGLVCRAGTCAVQCRADIDCVPPDGPGGVCRNQVCAFAGASTGDASLDAPPDAPPGYGRGCNLPSDCPSGLRCGAAGQCVYECDLSEDCANGGLGYCCVAHTCHPGQCPTEAEAGVDAGANDAGCKECSSNDECQNGIFCDGVEECTLNCCRAALDTPCDSHSACIVDQCDEATKTCSHTTVAGMDVDGDGHLAFGCVGGDDCNDEDPTVYTGHPEVYDGKDNDCNGYIDDWTAEPKGLSPVFTNMTGSSDAFAFVVPVGGGPGDSTNGAWGITDFYNDDDATSYSRQLEALGWTLEPALSTAGSVFTSYPYGTFAAASEPTSAAFVVYLTSDALMVPVVKNDLSLTGAAMLSGAGEGSVYAASITWTGSHYLVGWNLGGEGYFGQVDNQGNLLGSQTVPTTGGDVYSNSAVGVASNGSALAVAYTGPGPNFGVFVTVFSESGEIRGTVQCAPGMGPYSSDIVLAVAGVPDAFVLLWADGSNTNATYVPALGGVPGSPLVQFVVDPNGHGYNAAQGAFDGVGAAFLMSNSSNVAFGYLNGVQRNAEGAPANPFELSTTAEGATLAIDLAGGSGGRLAAAFSYPSQPTSVSARQAGYCSLAGAACAAGSNCCSGECTPVVVGGPKAYSQCQ